MYDGGVDLHSRPPMICRMLFDTSTQALPASETIDQGSLMECCAITLKEVALRVGIRPFAVSNNIQFICETFLWVEVTPAMLAVIGTDLALD